MTDFTAPQTQWQMQKDAEHLRLLSIFFYVVAGLKVLSSCIFTTYIVIGLVAIFSPSAFNSPNDQQPFPHFLGGFFVLFGLILMAVYLILAILLAITGLFMSQRRHWMFCVIASSAACLFPVFGTILGIFALVVLMRPTVKTAFGLPAPPVPPTFPLMK